ncbi:polyprenyl synthetase family protein [Pseudoxanthomonas indica]|uniref:Farnesyl-diphosphate synthase n=1 Tax=Pseudoxanthomonas indica TaxID=428993 RepID=A0A1T5J8M5_9GAMM|nr:farnesyl diphosphate synthase [Pseudoxanthomonas indica]GGD57110.1 farnesyl-diphosphate synthase [Pseudoxanthomonas indica]SKC47666.1 farnesyl-diphosphate synthase [Pseudoxanthomonas indica]
MATESPAQVSADSPTHAQAPVFAAWVGRVEAMLERSLPGAGQAPQRLHAAMRHAVLGGGKRIRPLLVYAGGAVLGVEAEELDAPAAAVELIHAYSLVHDDLPAMDDDDLRRGRPTVHVAFDEATAILAGDALQTRAFEVLAQDGASAQVRLAWVQTLAHASGVAGMCGGQALDIDATGREQSLDELARMHAWKTGALIRASVRLGALAGGAEGATLERLDRFAAALGLAFQIRDDILDVEASSEQLGKTAGKDVAQAKSTYPALLGMEGAKARLAEQRQVMAQALSPFGADADALRALGELAVLRSH